MVAGCGRLHPLGAGGVVWELEVVGEVFKAGWRWGGGGQEPLQGGDPPDLGVTGPPQEWKQEHIMIRSHG